jgi:hypothetical protein
VKFLGAAERELASNIAAALLRERLEAGTRPDTAGREVAKVVADQVKNLRTLYEDRTVAELRKRGQLMDTPGAKGQPLPGGQAPLQPGNAYAAGQTLAREMFPNRFPPAQQQH